MSTLFCIHQLVNTCKKVFHGLRDFQLIFEQSPSLHGIVFVGTLSEAIPIRPIVSDENGGAVLQQTVQEIWEKKFKELSDDNPELTVSGIILFYPTYVLSYCEVHIIFVINNRE